MKTLIAIFTVLTFFTIQNTKIDFGNLKSNTWTGISKDETKVSAATVSYSDESVRLIGYKESSDENITMLAGPRLDFNVSDFSTVEVKYRAKGAAISMLMKIELEIGSKDFIYPFESTSGDWIITEIPSKDFMDLESEDLKKISKKELKKINKLAFLTSNDYTGAYALEVDYIEFN